MPKGVKGFQKGGSVGRPKGIKDKRTRYYDVIEALEKHDHDPIVAMIKLAKDETAEPELRFKADRELIARIAPVLKAIEHSGVLEKDPEVEALKEQMREIEKKLLEKYKKEF